jgi:hypothetical protein
MSYNDVFNELQDYILNEENIQKSLRMKLTYCKNEKPVKQNIIIKKQDIFTPNQNDTLFWCYFI